MAHPVPTALSSTTGRGPTVKTNSQKAKKGLPHGELQRIINFLGVPKKVHCFAYYHACLCLTMGWKPGHRRQKVHECILVILAAQPFFDLSNHHIYLK